MSVCLLAILQLLISKYAHWGIQYGSDTPRHLIIAGMTMTHTKPDVVSRFRSPDNSITCWMLLSRTIR
jgi:hypothetical protein